MGKRSDKSEIREGVQLGQQEIRRSRGRPVVVESTVSTSTRANIPMGGPAKKPRLSTSLSKPASCLAKGIQIRKKQGKVCLSKQFPPVADKCCHSLKMTTCRSTRTPFVTSCFKCYLLRRHPKTQDCVKIAGKWESKLVAWTAMAGLNCV